MRYKRNQKNLRTGAKAMSLGREAKGEMMLKRGWDQIYVVLKTNSFRCY